MKILRSFAAAPLFLLAFTGVANAQSWQPISNPPSFPPETALLLTDGTVMVHAYDPTTYGGSSDWWRLTPDANGSYVNGTWSQLASMPGGYSPVYFASAVLPDGRVLVEGGEYNGADVSQEETTMGAIYDPVANSWSLVAPPSGWTSIGDAPSVVLDDGTFMIGSAETTQQALFDARTLTWKTTGTGKADPNSEEGWTLLPGGSVLTVDVVSQNANTEIYRPKKGEWKSSGNTPASLTDANYEMGAAMLRPDGTVFAVGDNGHTAVFHPHADDGCGDGGSQPGTWTAGPDFPVLPGVGQLDMADGPAVLLPNGNVLCVTSPGVYQAPVHVFEFDGRTLTQTADPPDAPYDSSYYSRLLLLPTGEVLFADGSGDVQIYSSSGTYQHKWAPRIQKSPSKIRRGHSYEIEGTQFNGLSQAVAYGDDVQAATNYPLVRIVNLATGHVAYARTHDHSTMAVATGDRTVSTHFDVPPGIEAGKSLIMVVANGIPSPAEHVTVE